MIVESLLLLENNMSLFLLGDGASRLIIYTDIISEPVDHQWDGKIIPIENNTIAYHVVDDRGFLVTKIIRYNRSPSRIYQYACSLRDLTDNSTGVGDVWWEKETSTWKCGDYNRVHYRDKPMNVQM
jgi:hypothetical protein